MVWTLESGLGMIGFLGFFFGLIAWCLYDTRHQWNRNLDDKIGESSS